MKLAVGPLSVEFQSGKPYFLRGYQIEPRAWIWRLGGGGVCVPSEGAARWRGWGASWVRPSSLLVTDSLGRRYVRPVASKRLGWRIVLWFVLAGIVLGYRRYRG
jgi:hypothetical protein